MISALLAARVADAYNKARDTDDKSWPELPASTRAIFLTIVAAELERQGSKHREQLELILGRVEWALKESK